MITTILQNNQHVSLHRSFIRNQLYFTSDILLLVTWIPTKYRLPPVKVIQMKANFEKRLKSNFEYDVSPNILLSERNGE